MSTAKLYTRLFRKDAVVLLLDHQSGLIPRVQDFSLGEVKNNVLALADLAKFFKLPAIAARREAVFSTEAIGLSDFTECQRRGVKLQSVWHFGSDIT